MEPEHLMGLSSTMMARERILLCGSYGSGKSRAAASLIRRLPDSPIAVVETDFGALEMKMGEIPANATLYPASDWEELRDNIAKATLTRDKDAWVVVDRWDEGWEWVQDWYSEQVYGKASEQFFLEARINNQESAFQSAHGKDWGIMNKQVRAVMNDLSHFQGHVLLITQVKPVTRPDRQGKGGDEAGIVSEFGPYGVRPAGWKHTMKHAHTILWMEEHRPREWRMTTMRDRGEGREAWQKRSVDDFVLEYLVKTAGWRPA